MKIVEASHYLYCDPINRISLLSHLHIATLRHHVAAPVMGDKEMGSRASL